MQHHLGENDPMGSSVSQSAASSRWLWLAGCLAPLATVAAVLVFNVPLNTVLLVGLLALCPWMHLFMMRGGGHRH